MTSIFKTTPYAHQQKAFDLFKDSDYFALFMDMGTGKTKTAIDIASYKFSVAKTIDSVMVIAPNGVHDQWISEQYKLHCGILYEGFIWKSSATGTKWYRSALNNFIKNDKAPKLKVFSINVEAFQSESILPFVNEFIKANGRPFIIIDEATRVKTPTAKRTKAIMKMNRFGQRCILTGTPTAKSPFDLYAMFSFLKQDFFDCNFFIFQHRYGIIIKQINEQRGTKFNALIDRKGFNIIKNKINKFILYNRQQGINAGKLTLTNAEDLSTIMGTSVKNILYIESVDEFTRFKQMDKLKDMIKPHTFSVRKADCLDLPAKVYKQIKLQMSTEQAKLYNTLKKELIAQYQDTELTVVNKISLSLRLMQICGGFFPYQSDLNDARIMDKNDIMGEKKLKPIASNPKLKELSAQLDELGDNEPLIIWAAFTAELEAIHELLKYDYNVALYHGATSQRDRTWIVEDFKKGKIQIFISNVQTAGFGLNFQHCSTQFFYSNNFRTEARLQAEDRTHRMGNKGTCVYTDFIIENSLDEKIVQNLAEGKNLNEFFKDNSLSDIL